MRDKMVVHNPTNWTGVLFKCLALLALLVLTNFGFLDRIELLYASSRWFTLAFYLGMWGVSFGVLIIAAFQPNLTVRLLWAGLISASTATAFMYTSISGSDLSVFDALSLWTARHEAHRALDFYQSSLFWAVLVFLVSFIVIAIPPTPQHRWVKFGLKWMSWTPIVPVAFIAIIILLKEGGGSQAMPSQFQPLAVGAVTAVKTINQKQYARNKVALKPSEIRPIKHVVMLIDESVRPDYFNWKPGNPYTPLLAANQHRLANFGQASSGGNCSSYSNAILRLGGTPDQMTDAIRRNPSIWQYAKKAGFRTIYIDGQSGLNKDPGLLQNFMTVTETKFIDKIVRFTDVAGPQLDFKLLEALDKELQSDEPVFIYANKNGAHFPYDNGYPAAKSIFEPTISQTGKDIPQTRTNSYLNVIRWSVDGFFGELFQNLDLKDTAIIYTSDHGQALANGQLTHCSVTNSDAREGLVPMFAITGNEQLAKIFVTAAEINQSKTSHFAIRPTVLKLMGYNGADVEQSYGPSLFAENNRQPGFTSGDIFGVFKKQVRWTPLDLTKNYLEYASPPKPTLGPVVKNSN